MTGAVPEDVLQFILSCLDSVEQLEVLLLLHGSPEVAWSAEDVARALYSNAASIAVRLAGLRSSDLLNVSEQPLLYRYQPKSPALHATIVRLAETYRERRVAVITVIGSKPMQNIRAFSEAFRIRSKDKQE